MQVCVCVKERAREGERERALARVCVCVKEREREKAVQRGADLDRNTSTHMCTTVCAFTMSICVHKRTHSKLMQHTHTK